MGTVIAKAFGLAIALVALNLVFGTVPAFPVDVSVGFDLARGHQGSAGIP